MRAAILTVFFTQHLLAQGFSSFSGKVINIKTNEPLPNAIVYLANTTHVAYTNERGEFMIEKIALGQYNLVVSMLGYKTFNLPVNFKSPEVKNFTVAMNEKITELSPVTVIGKKIHGGLLEYQKFVNAFLGQTKNAKHCKIVNKKVITVYIENNVIYAMTEKPIEVENKALGYKLFYDLNNFSLDNSTGLTSISGIVRFENLQPENLHQSTTWVRERDRAYYGSVSHFLSSLRKGQLNENKYKIYNEAERPLIEKDVTLDSTIHFKGIILIRFDGERPEFSESKQKYQSSSIHLTGVPIRIYENGYFFNNYKDIVFQGYLGWSSGVAELLPLGYLPTKPLIK